MSIYNPLKDICIRISKFAQYHCDNPDLMECEYDFIKELEGRALDYLNYHNIGQNDFDSCNTFYNIYDEECSDDYDYYEANQHEANQTDCFEYENFSDNLDYENERAKNFDDYNNYDYENSQYQNYDTDNFDSKWDEAQNFTLEWSDLRAHNVDSLNPNGKSSYYENSDQNHGHFESHCHILDGNEFDYKNKGNKLKGSKMLVTDLLCQ